MFTKQRRQQRAATTTTSGGYCHPALSPSLATTVSTPAVRQRLESTLCAGWQQLHFLFCCKFCLVWTTAASDQQHQHLLNPLWYTSGTSNLGNGMLLISFWPPLVGVM